MTKFATGTSFQRYDTFMVSCTCFHQLLVFHFSQAFHEIYCKSHIVLTTVARCIAWAVCYILYNKYMYNHIHLSYRLWTGYCKANWMAFNDLAILSILLCTFIAETLITYVFSEMPSGTENNKQETTHKDTNIRKIC